MYYCIVLTMAQGCPKLLKWVGNWSMVPPILKTWSGFPSISDDSASLIRTVDTLRGPSCPAASLRSPEPLPGLVQLIRRDRAAHRIIVLNVSSTRMLIVLLVLKGGYLTGHLGHGAVHLAADRLNAFEFNPSIIRDGRFAITRCENSNCPLPP